MASGATSIWGRPYPLATDTPTVHTDIQALANSLETVPLFPTVASSSRTGVVGESALCTAGIAYTLPSSPTTGAMLRVVAASAVTGASPVTVAIPGSQLVSGKGIVGTPSSLLLGAPGSHMTLQFYGAGIWWIIDGEQDTGWVSLTLGGGITAGSGTYPPAARLVGDMVRLCGNIVNGNGTSVTTPLTVPTGLRPAFLAAQGVAGATNTWSVATNGTFTIAAGIPASFEMGLDAVLYRIS